MRTVRLASSRLFRLNGPPRLMPGLPDLVLADVRDHAQTAQGATELAELTEAPRQFTAEELTQCVLAWVETGRLNWEPVVSALVFVGGGASIESVSLSELAEPVEIRPEHALVIELLGEDDSPIGGVRYEVTLPNGSLRTGTLDAEGRAEFNTLSDPGECKIRFPTLDKDAWEHIQSSPL